MENSEAFCIQLLVSMVDNFKQLITGMNFLINMISSVN